jgi:type IV secretory pathway VirB9-like protein
MKTKLITLLAFSLMAFNSNAAQRVRRVEVHGDQIVTVRTSIGIATIIQVPDRPNSVVVGDQDSFKVEYLDQAITIKPLSSGGKTNLYVYTDWKRYNVELISGHGEAADYVVYLDNPKEKPRSVIEKSPISWTPFKNSLRNENLTLETKRLGRTRDGILLVEFHVRSSKKDKLNPEWLWITQGGETKPIHNLFLSHLEVAPVSSVQGVLQLRRDDVAMNEPIRFEMRRTKTSYLTLTKASAWK